MKAIFNWPFIRKFLLHVLIAWLAFNIGDWILHFYNVQFGLAYTVNKDGSSVSSADRFVNNNISQPLVLWILLLAFLSEVNYQYIFFRMRFWWFVPASICLAGVGGAIAMLFQNHSVYVPTMAQYIDSVFFILIYIIIYAILFNFFYERYYRGKLKLKQSESELHLLKSQINPHFFFNTLNNLYGMALNENATQTAEAIELLADMMRYNMEGNKEDLILVSEEINFIENYLKLQRLRIPPKGSINIRTEIDCLESTAQIAPMLLIPLIENAWKYGISMDKPCYINLKIRISNDELSLFIENSVFNNHHDNRGSGLGIENVRQRLQLIYPDKHKLEIESNEHYHGVSLTISLH